MSIDFMLDLQLYLFELCWFDSLCGCIYYVDEGMGLLILLCYGNLMWSFLYWDIIVVLWDCFCCVVLDYLGFGLLECFLGFGYQIDEYVWVIGEFVDYLGLDCYLSMGQDWGGLISMVVVVECVDWVCGVVLGNMWFWLVDMLVMKVFSRVMFSLLVQYVILWCNFFVECLIFVGIEYWLSSVVMVYYWVVQFNVVVC